MSFKGPQGESLHSYGVSEGFTEAPSIRKHVWHSAAAAAVLDPSKTEGQPQQASVLSSVHITLKDQIDNTSVTSIGPGSVFNLKPGARMYTGKGNNAVLLSEPPALLASAKFFPA